MSQLHTMVTQCVGPSTPNYYTGAVSLAHSIDLINVKGQNYRKISLIECC